MPYIFKKLDIILKNRGLESDIQLIISTHSPFLITDVLSEQIIRLDVDSKGYCIIKNDTKKNTFGANIYSVLADSFFLNYTIGEYSREFLQEKMEYLRDIEKRAELKKINLDDESELKRIVKIIPFIGDPLIRKGFISMLQNIGVELKHFI